MIAELQNEAFIIVLDIKAYFAKRTYSKITLWWPQLDIAEKVSSLRRLLTFSEDNVRYLQT